MIARDPGDGGQCRAVQAHRASYSQRGRTMPHLQRCCVKYGLPYCSSPALDIYLMDGPSAHSKRMVQWRDAMTTRRAKLVTFVISLMTDITNGVAQSRATLLTLDRTLAG
jgi:hypothetical protein